MSYRRLKIIPKPEEGTRAVIVGSKVPVIKGTGEGKGKKVSGVCGFCETTLIRKNLSGTVRNIVLLCPVCGKFNDTEVI